MKSKFSSNYPYNFFLIAPFFSFNRSFHIDIVWLDNDFSLRCIEVSSFSSLLLYIMNIRVSNFPWLCLYFFTALFDFQQRS